MAPMHYRGPGILDFAYEYKYTSAAGAAGRTDWGPGRSTRARIVYIRQLPMQLSPVQLGVSVRALHPTTGLRRTFATGLSAVYHRDRERSSLLAVDQCTVAYLSL